MPELETSITIVGLGPGDCKHLTLEAVEVLERAGRFYIDVIPAETQRRLAERFPELEIVCLSEPDAGTMSPEESRGPLVSRLLELAAGGEIVFGVAGSPTLNQPVVSTLQALASTTGVSLRIVQGLSEVEPVLDTAGAAGAAWLTLIDATEADTAGHQDALGQNVGREGSLPLRTPLTTTPMLISRLSELQDLGALKAWLCRFWPQDHEVTIIRSSAAEAGKAERLPLRLVDAPDTDPFDALFIPALVPNDDIRTFDGLLNVTRTLRAPGGCPWDREQTHDSLKTHLLEETYEVLETLDAQEYEKLAEELGDLLFQVTIHAQIAAEHCEFEIGDVLAGISSKLIRRHPHVFGDLDLGTSAAVLARWEGFKQLEKPERDSILSSIPRGMPALPYSYAVQKRVANQGFDWPTVEALLAKVDEELAELRETISQRESHGRIIEELGDLLFVIVSVARQLKMDPEESLRKANHKFVERFKHVERAARSADTPLSELSAEKLDRLWEQAKARGLEV
jgi:tetrapyrrole methylase family protein/MazG family protein